jgi:alpha-galactosidase
MHRDYTIPEEFGCYHTVGDTAGPAGISRALRNVPVFVGFARMMEKLCPKAWMVHVTNPLSQITRGMYKASAIRTVGLCHNWVGTLKFLGDYFGVPYTDVDAVSVGVNHGSWMKNITVKGKNVEDQLDMKRYIERESKRQAPLKTGTVDDQVNAMLKDSKRVEYYLSFELFKRFGYFPVGGAPHVVENYPFYCNSLETLARHYVHRKGVLPMRARWKEHRRQAIEEMVKGKRPLPELTASHEGLAEIADGLLCGNNAREIVSLPNTGQITNLPKDVIVETLGVVGYDSVTPVQSGQMPAPLLGWMQTLIHEQELAVEAALTGNRDLVVQAMTVSPMLAEKDRAAELAGRLLEANRDWLPQFFKKKSPRRKK